MLAPALGTFQPAPIATSSLVVVRRKLSRPPSVPTKNCRSAAIAAHSMLARVRACRARREYVGAWWMPLEILYVAWYVGPAASSREPSPTKTVAVPPSCLCRLTI